MLIAPILHVVKKTVQASLKVAKLANKDQFDRYITRNLPQCIRSRTKTIFSGKLFGSKEIPCCPKSSVFPVHTKPRKRRFQKFPTLKSVFEKLRFRSPFSPGTGGRKANPQRNSCDFKRKRICVSGWGLSSFHLNGHA